MTKSNFISAVAFALMALAVSCQKEHKEYVTLSQLASKCEGSGQFDVYVQNVYVTAASDGCAIIEDKSQALQLTKAGHSLKAGSVINGRITGKVQQLEGNMELSDISVVGASVTPTDTLPTTTATIDQILSNDKDYRYRRVKLENIMFTDHFNGHLGDQVVIVQNGKPITIEASASGYYALSGDRGDIICYPSDGIGYVFTDKEFFEHDFATPLSVKSDYGIYTIENNEAKTLFVYTPFDDQYALGSDSEKRFFRIQNFDKAMAVSASLTAGAIRECSTQEVTLEGPSEVINNGGTGTASVTLPFFIEKKSEGKLWLMNYENGIGVIIKIEE